jgi:diamine N-acetyltransferase
MLYFWDGVICVPFFLLCLNWNFKNDPMKLGGKNVLFRALEPSDVDVLYDWENDTENWLVSNTQSPFSRFVLEQYLASAHQDIYSVKQQRFMICRLSDNKSLGTIELFDFDPNHQRAGIGILIADKSERKKGYASEALDIMIQYGFEVLNLHQLYCNITVDNESSISLFQKHKFEISGNKKKWIRDGKQFKDELILQRFK